MNRQDACSTRKFTLCGTGILPVFENAARCALIKFNPRLVNKFKSKCDSRTYFFLCVYFFLLTANRCDISHLLTAVK